MTDLSTLASSVLVTIFNNLASQMPEDTRPAEVKKFSDKKAGIRRVEGLLEQVNTYRAGVPLPLFRIDETGEIEQVDAEDAADSEFEPVTVADDLDQVRELAESHETETETVSGETGLESAVDPDARTSLGDGELIGGDSEPAPQETTPKAETKVETATKATGKTKTKGPGGRPPSVSESDVITLLKTDGNPKRAAAADRFNCYKTGITVGEYMTAIGGDRKQALRDISWDMKQKWISIAGAKGTVKAEPEAIEPATSTDETAPEASAQSEQVA